MNVAACCEDVQIAGGVEHMDHVPMNKDYNPPPGLFFKQSEGIMNMGLTAEYMAQKYQIPREKQDEFSLRSHRLAAEATTGGGSAPKSSRPGDATMRAAKCRSARTRASVSMHAGGAGKLPPAFDPAGGSVTAGNSSQVSVGATAVLVMSEESCRSWD